MKFTNRELTSFRALQSRFKRNNYKPMDTKILEEGVKELERAKRDLRVVNDCLSSLTTPRVDIAINPFGEFKISYSDFTKSGLSELLLDFLESKVSDAEEAIRQAVINPEL